MKKFSVFMMAILAIAAVIAPGVREHAAAAGPGGQNILVTGFEPFFSPQCPNWPTNRCKTNITKDIVEKLDGTDLGGFTIRKLVMDVKWGKPATKLQAAINQHKPVLILGLGQCGAGGEIQIEEVARNKVNPNLTGQ